MSTDTESDSSSAEHPEMTIAEVLRHRGVRPLLGVFFLSATASIMQAVALGAFVYDISGRTLDLGFLGLAEFAPSMLLVLVTGEVADRFDRRRVIRFAFVGELVCAAGLLAYAASDPTAVWPIFVIVVGYGIARAFMAPSSRSLPANVAPPGGLQRVVAMYSTTWQASSIAGPAIAGVLYAVDPTVPFAVICGLISAGCLLTFWLPDVRVQRAVVVDDDGVEQSDRPSLRSALEGLSLVRRTPILLGAISLDLFAVLFGGAVFLIPAIVDRLGKGPEYQGWLRAGGGIGASIMALALIGRPFARNIGKVLLVSVAVFGLATIALGITRNFFVAFAAIAILSAADMVSVFIRSTLVPLATPDGTRGRVMAVEQVFIGASNELGGAESGFAASVLGTSGSIVAGGFATLAIVGAWWVIFPALRDVDRFSDVEHQVAGGG
jgi:MFS family permease